jgi:hypothetical protein
MKHIKPIFKPKGEVAALVNACTSNDNYCGSDDSCFCDGRDYTDGGGGCMVVDLGDDGCPAADMGPEPECFAGDESSCTYDGC